MIISQNKILRSKGSQMSFSHLMISVVFPSFCLLVRLLSSLHLSPYGHKMATKVPHMIRRHKNIWLKNRGATSYPRLFLWEKRLCWRSLLSSQTSSTGRGHNWPMCLCFSCRGSWKSEDRSQYGGQGVTSHVTVGLSHHRGDSVAGW